MKFRRFFNLGVLMLGILMLGVVVYRALPTSAASPGDVVINEIMYNPSTGNQDDEFLELYNTTGSPVDLTGWSFSAGITLSAPFSATIIPANGYILVSPNPTQTGTTYGQLASATYAGTSLSNGGETVTLVDNTAQVIDSVNYDDATPWPVSPDGSGPSLELKDSSLDNNDGANWGASTANGGTPLAQNSIVSLDPPVLSLTSRPENITPSDSPNVVVSATNADSVTLFYKVMYGSEQEVEMFDDGAHGDSGASDGVYGAAIPSEAAGQMVRYRVVAENSSASSSIPSADDSMTYDGYVVQDSSLTSQLPIIQWFIPDQDFNDIVTNMDTSAYYNCVVVYGNEFLDNAEVRIKGEFSLSFPKKSFKFKMPSGHKISMPGHLDRDIKEFHMDSEYIDESKAMTATVWQVAKEVGIDVPSVFGTRLQRNGQYEGYYMLQEKYEEEYRQEKGYDGRLYEEASQAIQPNDGDLTPIQSFLDALWQVPSPTRREYILDNVNIPSVTNYVAFTTLVNHHDWHLYNNSLQYLDSNDTDRWEIWPWDMDISMLAGPRQITPHTTPDYFGDAGRVPTTSVYDEPEGKEMFFRRLRTMADEYFGEDEKMLNMYLDNMALSAPEAALDIQKWGVVHDGGTGWTVTPGSYYSNIKESRTKLLARYRLARAVPEAQVSQPTIQISDVNDASTASEGFVELHNPGSAAVDVSGWRLDELDFTLPYGTVIASGKSVIIPRNDVTYRSLHPATWVSGELNQDIPIGGELTLLRPDSSQADNVSY